MNRSKSLDEENANDLRSNRITPAISSHFRTMYAMETIDVKTIKPLKQKENSTLTTELKPPSFSLVNEQLMLPLGIKFTQELPQLHLEESIERLKLSPFALRALGDRSGGRISDLLDWISSASHSIKGIGQGHLVEIQEKLQAYIQEFSSIKPYLDLPTFVRSLLQPLVAKERFLCFSFYGLEHYCPISRTDSLELSKMDLASRLQQKKRLMQYCNELQKKHSKTCFQDIADCVCRALWRSGMTLCRSSTCLYQLSTLSNLSLHCLKQICHLLQDFVQAEEFFLESYLYRCEKGLFACEPNVQSDYFLVIEQAKRYFYSTQAEYSLNSLICYLNHDFAQKWIGFASSFIEKCLRLSSAFRIWMNPRGNTLIQLKHHI